MAEAFLTSLEKKLIKDGYGTFTLQEKNALITILAEKEGMMYSDITTEYIMSYQKKIKSEILSETCDDLIINGFKATNGHTYRTNRDDQVNMLGKMLQLMNDPSITDVMWKTEDAGYVKHTKADWISNVFVQGLQHKELTLFKYNTLKGQVANAVTDMDVVNVAWS